MGSESASTPKDLPAVIYEDDSYVELTEVPLNLDLIHGLVKRPQAGAIVTFTGTTRDDSGGRLVTQLFYEAYVTLALRTMLSIASEIKNEFSLCSIAIVHRLGNVPIGEESIMIAVSSPHRIAAWGAGEAALERCKAAAEIWKFESSGEADTGTWKANKDVEPSRNRS